MSQHSEEIRCTGIRYLFAEFMTLALIKDGKEVTLRHGLGEQEWRSRDGGFGAIWLYMGDPARVGIGPTLDRVAMRPEYELSVEFDDGAVVHMTVAGATPVERSRRCLIELRATKTVTVVPKDSVVCRALFGVGLRRGPGPPKPLHECESILPDPFGVAGLGEVY